ncbi:MAG: ORF6N domain-containing protein [Pseudomonadota bacterium]
MNNLPAAVAVDAIAGRIALLRGQRVIVDADLAALYGVPTKRLNEQVKRNADRFPEDFMFQLSAGEKAEVVANCNHLAKLKFSKSLPYVFTEHGALMVASILSTPRAVDVSLYVVRAFVRLRELLSSKKELAGKLAELDRNLKGHDQAIAGILDAIRQLMAPPPAPKKRPIWYMSDIEK